ncbi:TetR family transcriptional regulator [uncultured Microbacterium sp.]|uniref:TetR family transcriptional regulator n=1 Tax=uncultured Microbacterium sp. TaxID=191216 RepID=UPI0025E1E52A|nr:TetR family transcriptional regulator [uncultured Microbacterium sp.]
MTRADERPDAGADPRPARGTPDPAPERPDPARGTPDPAPERPGTATGPDPAPERPGPARGNPARARGDVPTAATGVVAAGTARDRAKAERRRALLAAAARLFAERGFDGVTLEEIGAAAGVSGPAVYRHVAGKQALLGAILVDVSERLLRGGREVAAPVASPVATAVPAAPCTTAGPLADTPPSTVADRRVAESPRSRAHPASADPASGLLRELVDFHVAFALAEADVIRVQDRDLDRLSPADRRTVRTLQNAYVDVWTAALTAVDPDAETPAERRVRALACFGLINSTPHSVRGVPPSRVRPTLTRMALAALTA